MEVKNIFKREKKIKLYNKTQNKDKPPQSLREREREKEGAAGTAVQSRADGGGDGWMLILM